MLKRLYGILVEKVNAIQARDADNLVKKADYNTKIAETEKKILDHDHSKYITTQEFNKLTAENFAARLAQAKLAFKADIDDFVQKTNFDEKLKNVNKKVTSNKTKHVEAENKLKKNNKQRWTNIRKRIW